MEWLRSLAELFAPATCALCDGRLDLPSDKTVAPVPRLLGWNTDWAGAFCESCRRRVSLELLRPEDLGDTICSVCGFPLLSEQGLCLHCREDAPAFRTHRSLFLYTGLGKTLFRRYKFGGERRIAHVLAPVLAGVLGGVNNGEILPGRTESRPSVVPVPPRRSAKKHRPFDPVRQVLNRCPTLNIIDCLERRGTQEQKRLSREDRAANVLNAFCVTPGAAIPPHPVLVDDVFTTGATAAGCASLLREAGAKTVDVVTFFMD